MTLVVAETPAADTVICVTPFATKLSTLAVDADNPVVALFAKANDGVLDVPAGTVIFTNDSTPVAAKSMV